MAKKRTLKPFYGKRAQYYAKLAVSANTFEDKAALQDAVTLTVRHRRKVHLNYMARRNRQCR